MIAKYDKEDKQNDSQKQRAPIRVVDDSEEPVANKSGCC